MSNDHTFGPLTLTDEGARLRFALRPASLEMEIPPDFDQELRRRLDGILITKSRAEVVLDLENVPGVSSRQLGAMISLHKALRDRRPRLAVVGASPDVIRMLERSRTADFFEFV